MKKNKKKIFLSLLVLVSLVIGYACWNIQNSEKIFPTNEKSLIINFTDGKNIYVRTKVWGVSGNHEEIVFSETPITIPNKENDYIFYTEEVFYKIEDNILTIYVPLCDIDELPNSFKGIEVIINELDYSINYQKYGLHKINCRPTKTK